MFSSEGCEYSFILSNEQLVVYKLLFSNPAVEHMQSVTSNALTVPKHFVCSSITTGWWHICSGICFRLHLEANH